MIETIIYFTSKTLYSERTKYYNSGLALYGKPHASPENKGENCPFEEKGLLQRVHWRRLSSKCIGFSLAKL